LDEKIHFLDAVIVPNEEPNRKEKCAGFRQLAECRRRLCNISAYMGESMLIMWLDLNRAAHRLRAPGIDPAVTVMPVPKIA
jgi:hypothetical protein